MGAMQVAKRMTTDEFLALPEAEHSRPWSLVDGEVVVTEASLLHQRTVQKLNLLLHHWVSAGEDRGEVTLPIDIPVDDRNSFAPDLLWYSAARGPTEVDPRGYAMPDLAVEVRSPNTWRHDLGTKRAGYERAGLPELWLVDTKNSLMLVFCRSSPVAAQFDAAFELSRGEALTSPQLPGFELPVEAIFADR